MKIAISAESTIDMPKELLQKFDIKTTPFSIYLNDEVVADEDGVSDKIYDYVAKTKILPKTSAVNTEQYKQHFASLLQQYDAIVHVTLSSLMSSAYSNAVEAAKEFENVYIVDSQTLSTGIALLAIKGQNLAGQGLAPNKIAQELQNTTPRVQADFVLENLNYLYKGGRCSALALFGANILKIKPQILVKNGKMGVGKKYVGSFKNCVDKYSDDVLAAHPNPDLSVAFVTHSSPMPQVVELLKQKLQKRGFKEIYDTFAGGTICSHCGPNCVGILFVDKEGLI